MSEFDSSAAVSRSRAKKLADLLTTGEDQVRLWRPDELAAMFRHQMSAPMLVDLGVFDSKTAGQLRSLTEAQGLLLKSFGDLFHHPTPPVELLRLVKDFAKSNLDQTESGLPAEIATTLYYVSIATGLVRLDTRISQLSDTQLLTGLRRIKEQAWLDEPTRELLLQAIEKLSGRQPGIVS